MYNFFCEHITMDEEDNRVSGQVQIKARRGHSGVFVYKKESYHVTGSAYDFIKSSLKIFV